MSTVARKKALEMKTEYANITVKFLKESMSEDKLLYIGFDLMKALAK
jgi:hypothetical protein